MATISEALSIAVRHHQAGQPQEAERIYRQVLRVDPTHADALHLLGVLAHQAGRHEAAVDYIGRAIRSNPQGGSYYSNLGLANHSLGRLDEALASYRRALKIIPHNAEVLNNLANVLRDQGQIATAVECYHQAIGIKPDYAEAHYNLGNILKDLGRLDVAAASYRRAIKSNPHYIRAHHALGKILEELDEFDQAAACYRQIQQVHPDDVLAELKIACMCPTVFDDNEQIDRYRRELFARLKRLSEREIRIDLSDLAIFGSEPPFELQFHGQDDRPIKEAYAHIFRDCFTKQAPLARSGIPRIGFVVTREHEGVFLRCMRGILAHINRDLFELAVICSPAGTAKIRAGTDDERVRILTIPHRLDRAAEMIRAQRFDLLYFWEVGTDAINYFLPFFQLAPVQCTSWGVPTTSGIPQMDYYLSSELVEAADAEDHYSEKLYRAKTLLAYEYRASLPQSPKTREDFGFAASQNVYLCAQQLGKLRPDFDPILAGILRRDALGIIALAEGKSGHAAGKLRPRFAAAMPDVADRIVFLPQQKLHDYWGLVAASDVLLDPLHYGSALTAYDGFSFNKPIVTMPTRFRRGRYTLGCYRKMGLMDCIASDPQQYIKIAVRLGTDREYRRTVCSRIKSASDALFEDIESVRELERFFLDAVEGRVSLSDK